MYQNSDIFQVAGCIYTLYTIYFTQIGMKEEEQQVDAFVPGLSWMNLSYLEDGGSDNRSEITSVVSIPIPIGSAYCEI